MSAMPPEVGIYSDNIPVHLLAYSTFTNLQSVPTDVKAFGLRITNPGGEEIEMCPIEANRFKIYWSMDITKAKRINVDNFLDNTLLDKEVPPGHAVSGWSAWTCRNCAIDRNATMKFSIMISTGNIKYDIFKYIRPRDNMNGTSVPLKFLPDPPVDLLRKMVSVNEVCPLPGQK